MEHSAKMVVSMTLSDPEMDLDTLWDFDHPEESEKRFQDALFKLDKDNAGSLSARVEILSQIARAKALQGQLDDAEKALKEAEELLPEFKESYGTIAKIRLFIEKARVLILRKTPSQARPLIIEAWTLASNAGEDFYSINAAQMMAAIEPKKVQNEWVQRAIVIAESSKQLRAKQCLGALYTTHGWVQFDARQFETALQTFRKALDCIKDQGTPKKVIVAKWAVAKTLRILNRIEDALEIQKELLTEVNASNQKDGYVYEELAECLQSLRRSDEAQVYFEQAYRELVKDEWLTDNKPERIKRLKSLGKAK